MKCFEKTLGCSALRQKLSLSLIKDKIIVDIGHSTINALTQLLVAVWYFATLDSYNQILPHEHSVIFSNHNNQEQVKITKSKNLNQRKMYRTRNIQRQSEIIIALNIRHNPKLICQQTYFQSLRAVQNHSVNLKSAVHPTVT